MYTRSPLFCTVPLLVLSLAAAESGPEARLRLVPFPKRVHLTGGRFSLDQPLLLGVMPRADSQEFAASLVADEIAARLGSASRVARAGWDNAGAAHAVALWPAGARSPPALPSLPEQRDEEAYSLSVSPQGLFARGATPSGLLRGVQTAKQLLRANMQDGSIPALEISDWPSLRYRAFQDDLTRGPSTKLDVLKHEVVTGSEAKLNLFTYYMEHQFAFSKHPAIGPENGCLTPDELRRLVAFSQRHGVEVLGNQQSFAHFHHILKHDQYKHLRETGWILCPTREESYQLLDDLYSEQVPLLPFPMFNVCCDETQSLGTGPSKALADEIGVGGVYARHMRRIHDLLKDKYGKRMMMWGDIILHHPDHLSQIPKDTVMLTWGYSARPSFEDQIVPFAESGYEFFVCPGVSCWSRILPDFACAVTNIGNFVRDGVKHGASGMLNTSWDDDGETFFAPNWHAVLWSAECAWNASTTDIDDFNRRVGAVLFGEPGEHFGEAIRLLSKTHSLPGMDRMHDRRFWQIDTPECPVKEGESRRQARALLEIVDPAIDHLLRAREGTKTNGHVLDYYLFGARRMQLIGRRALGILDAAGAYERAAQPGTPATEAGRLLAESTATTSELRDAHAGLRHEYERLWHAENKPYGLDRVLARFDGAVAVYDGFLKALEKARLQLDAGKGLPSPGAIGLQIRELGVRRTRPSALVASPLREDASWAAPALPHRLGIRVAAGGLQRADLPVELDLPPAVAARLRAHKLCEITDAEPDGGQQRVLSQVDTLGGEAGDGRQRLVFLAPGPIPPKGTRSFFLYFGDQTEEPRRDPEAVSCRPAENGVVRIENARLRLLVGPEGAHVYRWEVKELGDVDLTQPGETGWSGFADMGGPHRAAVNRIDILSAGPVLARVRCTGETGLVKTISVFAGARWAEVLLNQGVGWFWNYDKVANFAADGPNPGTYLFSDGATGEVGAEADGLEAQVKRGNVTWCAKTRPDGLLLALITPEVKARHVTAPGSGSGGVGVEGSAPSTHFVMVGGVADGPPKETLDRLQRTLSLRDQAAVTVYGIQSRKEQ